MARLTQVELAGVADRDRFEFGREWTKQLVTQLNQTDPVYRKLLCDPVNIIGYHNNITGLGQFARSLTALLSYVCKVSEVGLVAPGRVLGLNCQQWGTATDFGVWVCNHDRVAAEMLAMQQHYELNARLYDQTINPIPKMHQTDIGVWFWDFLEPPEGASEASKLLTEVWAFTRFIEGSLKRVLGNVRYIPPFILPLKVNRSGRTDLQERPFTVLYSFDCQSTIERKNPIAAIKAFKLAFAQSEPVRLVIKVGNSTHDVVKQLAEAIDYEHTGNISVVTHAMQPHQLNDFLASADVFLSLHRTEGLGLHLAEMMSLGKPVVATAFGGNLDFMSDDSSVLVPYHLVPVGRDIGTYKSAMMWAEADVDMAAAKLRELWLSRDYRVAIGERAKQAVWERLNPLLSLDVMLERFTQLGRRWS